MSDGNIYTEIEQRRLDRVSSVRDDIVTSMVEGGVPDNVGEIRVLNEVLSAVEKTAIETANLRVKREDVANNGATSAMVVELLRQSRMDKERHLRGSDAPTLAAEHVEIDVVPGETDITAVPLVPSDFVAPVFDPTKLD